MESAFGGGLILTQVKESKSYSVKVKSSVLPTEKSTGYEWRFVKGNKTLFLG